MSILGISRLLAAGSPADTESPPSSKFSVESVDSAHSAISSTDTSPRDDRRVPSLKGRITVGFPTNDEDALKNLKKDLIKLESHFPITEIGEFETDDKTFLSLYLDGLFKELGYTFAFLPNVGKLLNEKFGSFNSLNPPELKGTINEMTKACHRLVSLILPTVEHHIDQNLCEIWKRVVSVNQLQCSPDLTAEEIRDLIQSDDAPTISDLDLRGLDHVEILPLEILAFKPRSLDVRGTSITHIPGDVLRGVGADNISSDNSQWVQFSGLRNSDFFSDQ